MTVGVLCVEDLCAAFNLHRAAVDGIQKSRDRSRDQVDDAVAKSLGFGDGDAFADGVFRPVDVSLSLFGNGLDECGRVVRRLFVRDGVRDASLRTDRVCGTDVSAGCHGGDAGCQRDERACGGGLGPGGGDVDHDGDPGCQEVADDLTGGFQEAARGVQADDKCLGPCFLGFLDRGADEIRAGRVDRRLDGDDMDGLGGEGPGPEKEKNEAESAFQGRVLRGTDDIRYPISGIRYRPATA